MQGADAGNGAEHRSPGEHEHVPDQQREWLKDMQGWLMVIATLVAGITYQVGLSSPDGLWQRNDSPVVTDKLLLRYDVFSFFNATSFAMSLAIIVLLMKPSFYHSSTRLNVLRVTTVLDLVGLTGAFVAGSFRKLSWSIYVLLLVLAVFCYAVYHARRGRARRMMPVSGSLRQLRPQA